MRKLIVYCDRCGREIEDVFHLTVSQERVPDGDEITAPAMASLHGIDICWDCMTRIQQFIIGNVADDTTADSTGSTVESTAPSTADPVMIEVDKSAAVATPPADTEDTADAPGAKGKLADLDPDYLRQLASEGLIPARIRDRIEQDYGIKVSISAVQYRLRKMGL